MKGGQQTKDHKATPPSSSATTPHSIQINWRGCCGIMRTIVYCMSTLVSNLLMTLGPSNCHIPIINTNIRIHGVVGRYHKHQFKLQYSAVLCVWFRGTEVLLFIINSFRSWIWYTVTSIVDNLNCHLVQAFSRPSCYSNTIIIVIVQYNRLNGARTCGIKERQDEWEQICDKAFNNLPVTDEHRSQASSIQGLEQETHHEVLKKPAVREKDVFTLMTISQNTAQLIEFLTASLSSFNNDTS